MSPALVRHVTCPLFTNVPFLVSSPRTSAFHCRSRLISNCNAVCNSIEKKMRQIGCFVAENSAVFHNSHLTIQVFLDRSRPGTSYLNIFLTKFESDCNINKNGINYKLLLLYLKYCSQSNGSTKQEVPGFL